MVGDWWFDCWSGPLGFTCWIFLLWYSVLFTVESLSLLFLLFISWFICSRRWCIDKLGVFHENRKSICLDPHLNSLWGWRCKTSLSPPVKYFTDRSKAVLLLWIDESDWGKSFKACSLLISIQQSVTSSNKQKYKWMASLWNISYCRKKCDILKWGYLYSSIVCARSTRHF